MRMWGVVVVSLLFVANAFAHPETEPLPDTKENRITEAQRYLSVVPARDLFRDMADNMAAGMPDRDAKELQDLFTKHIDMDAMERLMQTSMVKHFTAEELRALADFYGSSVGKSAMAKLGEYMADVMSDIQVEVQKALQRSADSN